MNSINWNGPAIPACPPTGELDWWTSAEQALPGQPCRHSILDLVGGRVARLSHQCPCIVAGLQETRHNHRLKLPDAYCLVFVVDEGA
jgi:hypothetical protein